MPVYNDLPEPEKRHLQGLGAYLIRETPQRVRTYNRDRAQSPLPAPVRSTLGDDFGR